jgi:hypothetical protein
MFNPLMMLALEANGVVALRMMKLMRGGKRARREAERMVSEKIAAAMEATASLMAGASSDEIVHRYLSAACSGQCEAAGKAQFGPKPCG